MLQREALRRRTALLVLLAFFLSLCAPAPAAAFFFGGVGIKDEKEMGRKFDAMLRATLSVVEDPEVSLYVNKVVARLTAPMPPQPYTFKAAVILHNSLNAFAVPGGYVYVFTGLLMNLDREDELAGVLAHELAHVTQRHVASRLERAQYLTLGSLLLAIAGVAAGGPGGGALAVGAMGAGQSAMLNYSRMDENEADHIGLQYLVAAGYPPSGMVGGFKILRQKSWMSGTSVPTYLSTHPAIGDRINGLQARIQGMPKAVLDRKQDNRQFLRVKTLLWGRYGDPQAALQRFAGKDALSRMGAGMVLARQNRVAEAGAAFDQALAAAPEDPLVLREAGAFHYRKGDMSRAGDLLRKALRLDPRDYMAAFFYARMLDETGRAREAAPYYRDVLRAVPEDAEVHEAFGRSLGKAGDTASAYIHLAYSAIYANNRKMAERYVDQARSLAARGGDKRALQRLETVYKERKELWESN
ncbi:beta-barrel assembly-enhancing protease [Desulfovibrio legallii]|uniref:Putative Zn-dependent protease, contains TPR repeats n=1 Tax=Desulfovibrio legallii TaxID=571438 RepID=A0A1G7MWS9_9BACT|nr:M48 family metallopeptidase [Desulfovibrio legallii]SDF66258.1 Putative Zn-dependent protease, contains TPR repeats [Desulfovibrio legallii]